MSQVVTNKDIKNFKIRISNASEFNLENKEYLKSEALSIAIENGVDLIEINTNGSVSICKLQALDKYLFELKKKEREQKAQQRQQPTTKILEFTPNTFENDIFHKANKAVEFLLENHTVRLNVKFKNRELSFKVNGENVLKNCLNKIYEISKKTEDKFTVTKISMEGNIMSLNIKLKK